MDRPLWDRGVEEEAWLCGRSESFFGAVVDELAETWWLSVLIGRPKMAGL
jgi:hypothetical protein